MTTSGRTPIGRALFLAAALAGLQALTALGFGVFELTQIQPRRPAVGVTTVLTLLLYGGLLAVVARGLSRARRWSRGPAVATQLLHLPIAWSFASGRTLAVAIPLALSAIVILVCCLLPSSTALLTASDSSDGESETAASESED